MDEIESRKSVRNYTGEAVPYPLFRWIIDSARRTPSAGKKYLIDIYAIVNVGDPLYSPGLYKYSRKDSEVEYIKDMEGLDWRVFSRQKFIKDAGVVFVLVAVWERGSKYRLRARDFACIEAGHISQNIYLRSEGLGLGSCAVGVFDNDGDYSYSEMPYAMFAYNAYTDWKVYEDITNRTVGVAVIGLVADTNYNLKMEVLSSGAKYYIDDEQVGWISGKYAAEPSGLAQHTSQLGQMCLPALFLGFRALRRARPIPLQIISG